MYYIILLIVLTSMTTINLTTKYVKQEISDVKKDQGVIKESYLYIIAAIGGAIGNIFLYITLKELRQIDRENKYRFIIINTILVFINALIIYLIYRTGLIKL